MGTRVVSPELKERIKEIILLQERDNRKARIIDREQNNVYVPTRDGEELIRSQVAIHAYLEKVEAAWAQNYQAHENSSDQFYQNMPDDEAAQDL